MSNEHKCDKCENVLEEDGRCFDCDIEPILCIKCFAETFDFEERDGLCEECYGRANGFDMGDEEEDAPAIEEEEEEEEPEPDETSITFIEYLDGLYE
jgi:hypothetical protein